MWGKLREDADGELVFPHDVLYRRIIGKFIEEGKGRGGIGEVRKREELVKSKVERRTT